MATSLQTANYGFGKYAPNDVTSYLTDYNGAMDKIDGAIKGVANVANEAKATGDSNLNNIANLSQGLTATNKNVENLGKTQTAQQAEINNVESRVDVLERSAESTVINAYNGMKLKFYRKGNVVTMVISGEQTSAPVSGQINAETIIPEGFGCPYFMRNLSFDQAGHKFLYDLTSDGKFIFFYMLDAGSETTNWYGTITYSVN